MQGGSKKRASRKASAARPSEESMREEILTFPDEVTDPCDYERLKLLMTWLVNGEIAKMKVETNF